MSAKLEVGQVWEIRGWGRSGKFLLMEERVGNLALSKWFVLCLNTMKARELWADTIDDEEYSTRIL